MLVVAAITLEVKWFLLMVCFTEILSINHTLFDVKKTLELVI